MRRLCIELSIDHDRLSYEEMCEIIGIMGDSGWSIGDQIRDVNFNNLKMYNFSRWTISNVSESLDYFDITQTQISDRIRLIDQRIIDFYKNHQARVQIQIFVDEVQGVMSFGLSKYFLNTIALIDANIEFSIISEGD